MRRATLALVAVPCAMLSLLVAGCAAGSDTATEPKTMDFTLEGAVPHVDVTDAGAKGDSPGDTEELYAPLTRDGKPAGHLSGVMITEDGKQTLNANKPVVRPVIGGTKAYLGAKGEVTTTKQPDQTYVHQFHFSYIATR